MERERHRLVADVAILAADEVLLVRYRDVRRYDGQRGWFVPDDYLAEREDPGDAARRIAREQLGIELSNVRLVYVESFGDGLWHIVFHYAVEMPALPLVTTGANVLEHAWFGRAKLPPPGETAHEGWTLEIVQRALEVESDDAVRR